MAGGIDEILRHNLQEQGQKSYHSKADANFRNVYPAEVVVADDPLLQGRIKVRITSRDKNAASNNDLPWCIPFKSTFFYSKPRIGEMVFVMMEDPKDNTGLRYWTGPIHTTQYSHKIETITSARNILKNTTSNAKTRLSTAELSKLNIPQGGDVGLEGRDDAWVILKPKEIRLVAGAFKKGSFKPNNETPASLRITQKENSDQELKLQAYSRTDVTSTVINLYSHLGKFRDQNIAKFEINEDLESFGELSKSLSPSVKGDELVKLLDFLVRHALTHIHTPQSPAVPTSLSNQLSRYTVDGELQRLLSSYVRIN